MPEDINNHLMQRVQMGDTLAFEMLVKQNMNNSYFFVERMLQNPSLSEDVVQEGFLRVWENRQKWRSEANFKTWFFKILYNLCIDHIRKQKNSKALKHTFINELTEHIRADEKFHHDTTQPLQKALATLKPEEKAILFWFYYHAIPQQNIADMLGMSLSAVESSLFRIRQKLKAELL